MYTYTYSIQTLRKSMTFDSLGAALSRAIADYRTVSAVPISIANTDGVIFQLGQISEMVGALFGHTPDFPYSTLMRHLHPLN